MTTSLIQRYADFLLDRTVEIETEQVTQYSFRQLPLTYAALVYLLRYMVFVSGLLNFIILDIPLTYGDRSLQIVVTYYSNQARLDIKPNAGDQFVAKDLLKDLSFHVGIDCEVI